MFKKILATMLLVVATSFAHAEEIHKFDQVDWKPAGIKGVDMVILWGKESDNSAVYAFKIQPGVSIPAHIHSNDYWGVAVQGKWIHIDANGKKVISDQNSFVRVHGNDVHADSCVGPKACINIVDFDGARDLTFANASKK
ncbi:cupin domain-containing protein [Hydromonas duriensis]|uniref:ChrR-like cupin domain-containing protein n=1 Tax=Hydromonas duriensis TaxID=1527608 RepID=A0A4R6Y8A3_9BURK|nr:hypothetical protein [Hydromonas duriensis]TDR31629.1 hypothetical protein DFR44_10811 [Hydromonas duriensis]